MHIQSIVDTEFAKVSKESPSNRPIKNPSPSKELGIQSLKKDNTVCINPLTENPKLFIDLSSIISASIASQLSDSKWQNRKEALDHIAREVGKAKSLKISNRKLHYM